MLLTCPDRDYEARIARERGFDFWRRQLLETERAPNVLVRHRRLIVVRHGFENE
jgi:hypothetical protein